jgi:lipoate-protein ligase A
MRVLTSPFRDIGRHLELEDLLLGQAADLGPALLFSRNRPAVVFGKNQNAWREARPGRLAELGVETARRDSGGGAVYHDEGNLNFSLVLPRADFHRDRQFRVLLRALDRLGLRAELRDGTSLCAGGLKFSGSAFVLRRDAALHHGTFLVSSDLAALARALEPPAWSVAGRGVPSVRMPVANLSRLAPEITAERLAARLAEECAIEWGEGRTPERLDAASLLPPGGGRPERWTGREHAWGRSPDSTLGLEARLPGLGPVRVSAEVAGGRVRRADLDPGGFDLTAAWAGRPFAPDTLPTALPGLDPVWTGFLNCFLSGGAYDPP